MKKSKRALVVFFSVILVLQSFTMTVFATENSKEPIMYLTETRSVLEKEQLIKIYAQLFPDEYHYIEEYEVNGIREMDADSVKTIFNDSKEMNNTLYELIVMNNGQIFTNYSDETSDIGSLARVSVKTSGNFTVGDLNHYNTFSIIYTINYSGYDKINSCTSVTGSGFYLYPTNLSKKMSEDSKGPAHYSYNNVSMNGGSSVLYDIGVAVGKDKARGISQISTGADMWLWSFLYAFFG